MAFTDPGGNRGRRSVRLVFEYDGDDVRLVLQQPVDVVVTGFDVSRVARAGNFVEVRDESGAALASVPVRSDMADHAEVFPERPGDRITHVEVPRRGAFTVVVPASEAARRVAVVRVEREPGALAAPSPSTAEAPATPALRSVELADFALEA